MTGTVPRISPDELKAKLDSEKGVVIVDVRGQESFDALRIPGAVSMPKKDPATRWESLPRDKEIVLY